MGFIKRKKKMTPQSQAWTAETAPPMIINPTADPTQPGGPFDPNRFGPITMAPPVEPAPPFYAGPPQGFAATCTNRPLPPEARGTVQGLQQFLNQRGFGPVVVDGICGFQTFNAWQAWERAKLRMGTNQTQPANPPSRPGGIRIIAEPALPAPTPTAPLPVPHVPFYKKPIFLGAAAIILILIITRKK